MYCQSSSTALQNITNLRINEVDRTLQSVIKNVSELVKYDPITKEEIQVKIAKLKKEKLGVLALIARSQAALAEMEVLIAENEIRNEQLDLKRKAPCTESRKVMSLKKSKMPVDDDIGVNKKLSKDKPKNQSKTVKKPNRKTRNNKKTNSLTSPNSRQSQDTELTTTISKTNPFDKENYNPFPRNDKQVIVISNPPFRDNIKNNMAGYITADRPMETVNNFKDNSIYKRAEHTECLLSGNIYKSTSNRAHLNSNYNYNNTCSYYSKHVNSYDDKKCAAIAEEDKCAIIEKPFVNINILRKPCVYKGVPKNNKDIICSKKPNDDRALMSVSSSEMDVSDENIKTTNDIFKDIMNNKVCIKQENYDGRSFTSINTLHIDLQKSAEY